MFRGGMKLKERFVVGASIAAVLFTFLLVIDIQMDLGVSGGLTHQRLVASHGKVQMGDEGGGEMYSSFRKRFLQKTHSMSGTNASKESLPADSASPTSPLKDNVIASNTNHNNVETKHDDFSDLMDYITLDSAEKQKHRVEIDRVHRVVAKSMEGDLLKVDNPSVAELRNIQANGGAAQACAKAEKEDDPCKGYLNTGLVVGIYTDPTETLDPGKLTPTGWRYNESVCGRLVDLLRFAGPPPKLGQVRIFYNLEHNISSVAVVGLGTECQGYDVFEQMDEGKESIRVAAAAGCRALQKLHAVKIFVESFGHAESSAEGAALGVWLYQEKKYKKHQKLIPQLELFDDCDWTGWQIGLQKAAAQNLARQLMDTSANFMTPTSFAQNAVEVLCKSGVNVEVKVRAWAETQKMNAFLAAAQGSCEPPIFLELSYYGAPKDERPVVLVGKGITYNSGGLCLKNCKKQSHMRGDMGGAAAVLAACRAIAGLQLPINIRALIPLCENMPGCSAVKPGDVVRAMNGKSVMIESSDNAGRLCLADALVYAQNFWPRLIVDVGTMTYDIERGLGQAASGVFSNSEALWEYMLAASMHTGDRVWRLPLWEHFSHLCARHNPAVDVKTYGRGFWPAGGECCRVAAFLNEFVPCGDWLHMDTYGVMVSNGMDYKYLRRGMSGRPTRTLVEFLSQLVCNRE